jgi:2-keto-3-deoxy-L-rhamnonate aldolase RhmA
MRKNRLRQRLDAGQPTLGTHILSAWPTLVELVGQAGNFDYVEFTAEYGPFTMHDLDNLGRAFEVADLGGMIKIEQTQWTHQAMRAIGSGFQSALFCDIRTVEDARACVAAIRAETPAPRRGKGLLGVGMRRDVGTIRESGSRAYVAALDAAIVAIMVEKRQCVENLDAILSVPGIDMVQFGPADYAMSIGKAGEFSHPEVRKAERKTIETALKKGIHPRVEISEPHEAEKYIDMGVKHFCIGWDVEILHTFWRNSGETMRDLLSGRPGKSRPGKSRKPKRKSARPRGGYR